MLNSNLTSKKIKYIHGKKSLYHESILADEFYNYTRFET